MNPKLTIRNAKSKLIIRNIIYKIQKVLRNIISYLDKLVVDYFNDCRHNGDGLGSCADCLEVF